MEKQRVFEFLIKYFRKETNGRKSSTQDIINILEELQTKLKKEKKNNISPNIDQDLKELFKSINAGVEESRTIIIVAI